MNVFEFAGELERDLWLVSSFKAIDYSKKIFVAESFMIMYYSKGGISKEELEKMPLKEMELYLKEAEVIQKTSLEDTEEESRHG